MTGILIGIPLPAKTISHNSDVVNQLTDVINGAAEQMKEFTAAGVLICHRTPFEQMCKNMMMVLRLKRIVNRPVKVDTYSLYI